MVQYSAVVVVTAGASVYSAVATDNSTFCCYFPSTIILIYIIHVHSSVRFSVVGVANSISFSSSNYYIKTYSSVLSWIGSHCHSNKNFTAPY